MLVHLLDPNRGFTVQWLLGHAIVHEACHGGQAVLLFPLLDRSFAA